MSILYSTALIFISVLPGYAFRSGFLRGDFGPKHRKPSKPSDAIVYSIIPAIFLHIVASSVVAASTSYQVNVKNFVILLLQTHAQKFDVIIEETLKLKPYIIAYHLVLLIVSFILGHLIRLLIRLFELDIYLEFLRFSSRWKYKISGESKNFGKFKLFHKYKYYDFLIVDALSTRAERKYIYRGILDDIQFDEGNLEMITLKHTLSVSYSSGNKVLESNSFDKSELNLFFSYIENINIEYYYIKRKDKRKFSKIGEYVNKKKNLNVVQKFLYKVKLALIGERIECQEGKLETSLQNAKRKIMFSPLILFFNRDFNDAVGYSNWKYSFLKTLRYLLYQLKNFFLVLIPDSYTNPLFTSNFLNRKLQRAKLYLQIPLLIILVLLSLHITYMSLLKIDLTFFKISILVLIIVFLYQSLKYLALMQFIDAFESELKKDTELMEQTQGLIIQKINEPIIKDSLSGTKDIFNVGF